MISEEKRNRYFARKQVSIHYLRELILNIRNFKEMRANVFALSIRSSYLEIAVTCLLVDEIFDAKKNLYKGAKITCEVFKIFKENRYPNLLKTGNLPFTALFVNSFLDAILCDSEELLIDYARTIEDLGTKHPPFNYEITYALKHLVLGDFEKAREHAIKAHQVQYFKLPYNGFSHVVMGILERDIQLINEGIALRLKHHDKENRNSIFYSTSMEATALVKLAMRFGLAPDSSSSFISKALLQTDTGIQYEGIDYILGALQEADQRNGSFINRISAWFRK
jgi:hypothetical protein